MQSTSHRPQTRWLSIASTACAIAMAVGLIGTVWAQVPDATAPTQTPIDHVVVIFQENVSFDHYFGTYPVAQNPPGEPAFSPSPNTPSVNGLNDWLLKQNPNAANPRRLDRSEAVTCDMDHGYTHEQQAVNFGLMNAFVENTSGSQCDDKSQVMDYYDGNTVTALWNYAQHFAMSDNSFGTTYGPSTPGALNLVTGQTHGATPASLTGNVSNGTVIGDARPSLDECWTGDPTQTVTLNGRNVGDLLNAKSVSWGWFQGGFRRSGTDANGRAVCDTSHNNIAGASVVDYIPHHEPFQYYAQTANPSHTPPASVDEVGHDGPANHQYDLEDFWAAVDADNVPAVSFLKAPGFQDGHAGYSDPLDEQMFLVSTINRLENSDAWPSTAIIIAYDDSDGWYDHVVPPVVNQSNDASYDALTGTGSCGAPAQTAFQDRCGYGPRLPLLVISPYARVNYVDHAVTDQTSVLRFIEDNWTLGQIGDQSLDERAGSLMGMFDFDPDGARAAALVLDPSTGAPSQ